MLDYFGEMARICALDARDSLRQKFCSKIEWKAEVELEGKYLVSTEKGVYEIGNKKIRRLLDMPVFGMDMDGDKFFVSFMGHRKQYNTQIGQFSLNNVLRDKIITKKRTLYSLDILDTGQRIHQICVNKNKLYAANTSRNSILEIGLDSGEKKEICPFLDRFGVPITSGQNHINSISTYGDNILFTAYRTGDTSSVCLAGNGKIICFPYENKGIHDIYIYKNEIYFSDTFGKNTSDRGGFLIKNGKRFCESFFKKPPGYVIRGLAGQGDELLIGHSHKGERRKRFDGKGAILVSKNGHIEQTVEMPFSQIYDIINCKGWHFEKDRKYTHEEIKKQLTRCLGTANYEADLEKCII